MMRLGARNEPSRLVGLFSMSSINRHRGGRSTGAEPGFVPFDAAKVGALGVVARECLLFPPKIAVFLTKIKVVCAHNLLFGMF